MSTTSLRGPDASNEASSRPTPLEFTKENFRRVADHFRGFFAEIGDHILEREDLITQAQLAMLSGTHLLILGHPGTAKSEVSRQVFQRVVDKDGESNLYDIQLNVESRRAEVVGPKLPQTNDEGVMKLVAQIEEGIAESRYAFLDEIFDAPPAVLRGALLTILVDRAINDGKTTHPISLTSAAAASNKTMEQLRSKFGNELDALLDRFAMVYWTVKRPLREDTGEKIICKAADRAVAKRRGKARGLEQPPMTTDEMDLLQTAVYRVQDEMVRQRWPLKLAAKLYFSYHEKIDQRQDELGREGGGRSKLESPRTLCAIIHLLPAIAVMRHIQKPETPLAVMPEDFELLKMFLMMRGPVKDDFPPDLDAIGDKEDAKMLKRLQIEDEVFTETYAGVVLPEATRLSRLRPSNFNTIKTTVSDWKTKTTTARLLTPEEMNQGIMEIERVIGDLAGFASQVAGGEELYADAVTTYINLLTIALSKGANSMAREKFKAVQFHVDSFKNSFYRSPLEAAVSRFKAALLESYRTTSGDASKTTSDMLQGITAIGEDGDILEDTQIVNALMDAFKSAALARVLALTATPADFAEAHDKFRQMGSLREVVGKGGIGGRIPLDRLVEMHTLALTALQTLLTHAHALLSNKNLPTIERDGLLDKVNRALRDYKENGMLLNQIGTPKGSELPEAMVAALLDSKKPAKASAHPGDIVEGRVLPQNGEDHVVIEWKLVGKETKDIDQQDWQTEFKTFCLEQVVQSDALLLEIPEIRSTHDRLILRAAVAFGVGGAEKLDPGIVSMISEDFLELVRAAQRSGSSIGPFEFPIQAEKRKLGPDPLVKLAPTLKQSVEAAAERKQTDDSALRSFLESKSIQPTEANVNTMGAFLRAASPQTGTTQVDIETVQVEQEQVSIQEIIASATASVRAGWDTTHSDIQTTTRTLGGELTTQLLEDRLTSMAGNTSMLMDSAGFCAKWDTFFGAQHVSTNWDQIPIDLTSSPKVSEMLKEDVERLVAELDASAMDRLEEVCMPLQEVHAFLAGISDISAGPFLDTLKSAAHAKIDEWIVKRVERFESDVNAVTTATADQPESKIDALCDATTNVIVDLKDETARMNEVFQAAKGTFSMEDAVQMAHIQKVTETGTILLNQMAREALSTLQQLAWEDDIGFKMNDLSTLTVANVEKVEKRIKDTQCIKRIKQLIDTARAYVGSINGANTTELDAVQLKFKGVREAFYQRHADVRREASGI